MMQAVFFEGSALSNTSIYRISFVNQDKVYEVFAKQVYEADLYGFIVVEELVFGTQSELLIDPAEERLKTEFDAVARTFIPMHAIIRIDEVEKPGISKIHPINGTATSNVSPFTRPSSNKKRD
ncbi:DUF1820 family protein [Thiofilum flexile]|uniref:DUF1820 family protein n=1 Tax=Thiofilum flexile TaxID=125627 RepID=UPI0003652E97|nr:DUF1820 family protein [Thiofilum flexile]